MKTSLRNERYKLLRESYELKALAKDDKTKNTNKLNELQDKKWKEYKFFDGFIKAKEKIK